MYESNHLAEQQYLAGERKAELTALLNDPDYYLVPCDRHTDIVTDCSGCQRMNQKSKGVSANA